MNKPCRKEHIDVLRGIGIVLMIMGHVGFGGKFDRYIHSFHMPLFFLISGYLYNKKKDTGIKTLLIDKVKRFIVPYLFFGMVNYCFWLFLERKEHFVFEPISRLIWHNTQGLPICGAIWFLTALFWTSVFYILIDRHITNKEIKNIVLLGISFGLSVLQGTTEFTLPLSIDIGIVGVGFYHIGRLFRNIEDKVYNRITLKSVFWVTVLFVLLLLNCTITFLTPYINMKMRWYGVAPVFWFNALIGTFAVYIFSVLVVECFFVHKLQFLKKSFTYIGRESLVFLGFNQLVILLLEIFFERISIAWLIVAIVKLGLTIALLICLARLFENKKTRVLIGK